MRNGETRYQELLKVLYAGTATVEDLVDTFDYIRDNLGHEALEKFQMENKELIEAAHLNVLPKESKQHSVPWLKYAAIAAGLVVVALSYHSKKLEPASASLPAKVPIAQRMGKIRSVQLPDRSIVVLKENAQVYYSEFSDSERTVSLIGEAYFDITPNPQRPFVIYSGDYKTKVLGTSFNLKSNIADSSLDLAVSSGVVMVESSKKQFGLVPANKRIRVDHSGYKLSRVSSDDSLFGWKSIVLNNVSVADVGEFITNRYGIEFAAQDSSCLSKNVYMKLDGSESLGTVMELLGELTGYHYGIGGRAALLGRVQ